MTFFKQLMRILSATLATAAVGLAPKLVALFQGAPPSDVSPVVWGIVGVIGVFLVNWAVGKIPEPTAP